MIASRLLSGPFRRPSVRVAVLLGGLMTVASAYAAAVAVSPVALYIDSRTRTGTLTLFNPGSRPEEVQVDFAFGYPVSDEEGNVTVQVLEEAPAGEPSAVGWLRAFPRRMVLEPGQRQVMRVMITPPAGLEDGEYWARALVRGRGGQPPIEERQGDVSVQIEVETVVVVAVNYRHGSVDTGLRVADARASQVGDTVRAFIDFERTGNAAYLGRVQGELLDASGRVLATAEEVLAVYRTIRRRLDLPVPAGAEGPLRVRYTMDTDRDDLPPGGPLPVDRVVHEVEVR
ncbi:MAG: hypothetical protein RJQ04_18750 [Longimicrobiales bacterium]